MAMKSNGKTKLISVTNGAAVAVTAVKYGTQIEVGEDPSNAGYPSVSFTVKKPSSSDQARTRPVGSTYTFYKPVGKWGPGDIVGYIQLVSGGPVNFFQDEQGF